MKKRAKKINLRSTASIALLFSAAMTVSAFAGTVSYQSPKHVFSINDVQCDNAGRTGVACLSPTTIINEKDGLEYYGIDSIYGYNVRDFDPTAPLEPRPIDGIYEEGYVRNLTDTYGTVIGVKAATDETPSWKAGPLKGEWLAGLGGISVKGATEHYRVMDHILNAEWMPPLIEAQFDVMGNIINVADYSTRLKDDGKILFFWGNLNKEPTELRLFTTMPLPAAWKVEDANYTVTSAKLVLKHRITTSPNDQIRPEDFENEAATGILPQYTICPTAPALAPNACAGQPNGVWVSAVDSTEGDGDFIPAGTVLRTLYDDIYPLTTHYFTNAWYTTLDRDPFGGANPRYRFKSSKYGQDLPGVEIPQYPAGEITTTTLDLLSIVDDAGHSVLAQSANWNAYLDINAEKGDYTADNLTADGCILSPDFDLMVYSKGEQKGLEVFDAQLLIEYDDPNADVPPPVEPVDVQVSSVTVPKLRIGQTGTIVVNLFNELPGVASGVLTVEVSTSTGDLLDTFSTSFSTTPNSTIRGFLFPWTAPAYKTTVTVKATALGVEGDFDLTDNERTTTLLIK